MSVVAVDTGRDRVAGAMWIAAKPGAINCGVIGRHGQCDLFLDGDAALSLRHLVVIVEPARDWGGPGGADVRYRLIDLRTGTAFVDEAGRQLEAATALGPAFVAVGRYLLLCFPTGGDEWPVEVTAAIAAIPERVYIDDRDAEPDRWRRRRLGADDASFAEGTGVVEPPRGAHASVITAVRGPARARIDARDHDEPRLGTLELTSRLGHDMIDVGADAVRRGLLLGRYSRCDSAGAQSLALERISRVHVLMIEIEGRLWMIDAASTNGISFDGRSIRAHAIDCGAAIELGGVGTARWRCASDDPRP
ncbi:MAG: hypothetical protein IPL61_02280 [Myxococcales bacterium]|nr:hypothetical protein [Myxococcales bacterium]